MEARTDRPAIAFGHVLKRHRIHLGLSQEQLARATGLDRTFVSLLERGKRQPSLTTLICISEALGQSLADLALEIEDALRALE